MRCDRCKLDHDLYADRERFDEPTARFWFSFARDTGQPIHPSIKVRICETLSEDELRHGLTEGVE